MLTERRIEELEARVGEVKKDWRIPTEEQERIMHRYIRVQMLGMKIPAILRRQVKKCRDQGPLGPGVLAMCAAVIGKGEVPTIDRRRFRNHLQLLANVFF